MMMPSDKLWKKLFEDFFLLHYTCLQYVIQATPLVSLLYVYIHGFMQALCKMDILNTLIHMVVFLHGDIFFQKF